MIRLSGPSALTLSLTVSLAGPASAEIKAIDDAVMSEITGTSGVTIELETSVSLARFAWKDAGSLNIDNIALTGQNDAMMDNMKFTLDIAGDNEVLDFGFSEIARRASNGQLDPNSNPDIADALATYSSGGSFGEEFNDGDMVIHLGPTDSGDPTSLDSYLKAIDFRLSMDSIYLEDSQGIAGTTMFSDITLDGYLGPTDIVVRNSDGATRFLDNGNEVSRSELQIDSHFEISQGSLNWDVADVILIFNLAAVGIDGLQMHNRRGADTLGHFGMASVSASLSSGTSAISGTEGLSIHDVEFRADIDMPVFRLGDKSIGSVNFTDFAITNTSLMVYGH